MRLIGIIAKSAENVAPFFDAKGSIALQFLKYYLQLRQNPVFKISYWIN